MPGDLIDSDLNELRLEIQKAVDQGADLMDCFTYFDRDRNGDLDSNEFFQGLRKIGVDVSRREAERMMDQFPSRRRGHINYGDFIDGLKLKRRATSSQGYAEGERVEVLYKGKGSKWYSGKVRRVNRDGTYDIQYDDGDSEAGALAKNIRHA